ncbi:MAG TPA: ASKHA domain-containing protein [bacterium]|nr:ASKHA domain-containing protein [bacterium]HOM27551.1 ASKHA domain-containing protein [bacterium]
MKEYFILTVKPLDKKIPIRKGTDILSALIKGNIFITSSCGGKGICGRCKVKILKGDFYSEPTGKITEEEKRNNIYLACRTTILDNMEIELLPETVIPEKIEREFEKGEEFEHIRIDVKELFSFSPLIKKIFLRLPSPNFSDTLSDYERVKRNLRKYINKEKFRIDISNLRKLPNLIRSSFWEITVTLIENDDMVEILNIEPGDTSKRNYGIAVDIGTTTISASLIDINKGDVLKTEITFNRQASFGDDIISRIVYAEKKDGLENLHHVVTETINDMIINLSKKCGISINDITGISISGNMTMVHLLLKINPSFLRKEPYIPIANEFPLIKSAEIGIKINPSGICEIVPGGFPYVGGDITSGIIVSGIYKEDVLSIFLDIGTNGEIVVGNKDFLVCCAASAGPCFEGSGVKNGVRAIKGAIQKVKISNGDVFFETIGGVEPIGICGSGYIELLSELYKNGIIDRNGNFIKENERIIENEGIKEFIVAENKKGEKIVITQADIDNLIRAKGAIYSAISTVLKTLGIKIEDVKKFYIAGGFGKHLNIKKSIEIGLFPNLPEERFKFLGNTSLLGAESFILSEKFRKLSKEIIKKLTYIDLSRSPIYMEEYLKALFIPHTDFEK